MAEKQNTPEIRFEGFTDPWEQRKLGELLLFQNGFNGSSESFGSGIPLISVMDVLDDKFITHETVRGKARLNCEEASRYCVEYGDVLFQRSSENQEDAGTSNVYLDQHVSSAFGGFVIRGKKVGEYNPIFIKYLLGSPFIREQITHRAQGAQHINVSQDTLADVVLLMPSMREQEAVGLVFLHLDNLITLHQRKHDKLCTMKRSMLDKMFPKPGETEPEIRFKGFTDPWEQRKFADFVTASGIRNSENLELPSYSVTNDRGFVPQDEQFENGGTMREADKTSYWIVEPKSFAYNPARINVGSIGYQSTSRNVIVSSLYEVFQADETCDNRFLWHWFKTRLFTQQIEMLQEGGVRLYFFFDKLLKSGISMPSVDEQRLIGEQFDRIDYLITLHQRKLDLLKNTKKSLLDKMFV